ncbi:FAD binding domain-containing protein [Noviherbaspirillum galbum]|uniref:Xanthine dehydrogenase family protein subunit M n=1 Tax=Noviherbaspirillum galbum TaxID=2709383 RepID=A0A6B3SUI2_9BURK|nr:xanthine dehydrogenase family protein subunit M [Noviherbaspirillum galbum]NEX62536.1 xanthine dehydrogenase family protein subunit M [Noviherbaspirillum galbum]
MKAPPFDYAKPASLDEAIALLERHGDDARLLAGGQTLLATLNMRLAEPALLIDLNGLSDLRGIALVDGKLRIGALATHAQVEASPLVAAHAPLLAMAAPHIAHRAIRNMGTFGGSIAYADPAAEWPACALALDAEIVVRGSGGERRIAAADFFLDLYTTSLAPHEILVACDIPVRSPESFHHFDELARRHGDYAVVGLAMAARRDAGGLRDARIAFMGIGGVPLRARATELALQGQALDAAAIDHACAALEAELDGPRAPMPDLTHSGATKRHLATVLLRRALQAADAVSHRG